MADEGRLKVDKFNGQNFQLWKMQMEDYLYQKDLWRPLEGIAKKEATMSQEEWDILDRKALGSIRLCLAQSVTFNITGATTAKDLMETLAKLYEKPSASNKVFLMKRLFNMKMVEGGSVTDHLNEFNTVTSQLTSVKITFDEEVRALLILCSLPESWNGLVMAVSNSVSGSNTLKYDDVIGVILSEEIRRKSSGGSTSGSALNAQSRGRTNERGNNSGNRGKSRGKSKGKRSESKGPNDCWYCGKPGHKKKDCWSRKKDQGDKNDGNKEANVVSNKSEEDALLLSLESIDDSWVLDSGASFHATPHRSYFVDYVQGDFGLVYLGDNEPCQIVGKGKIKIKLQNGNHWLLQEVRHVPRLSRNLISAGQLGDEGCTVTFNDKNWKVSKGSLVVAKGVKVGTLYLCTGHTIPSTLIVSEDNECSGTVAPVEQEEHQTVAVDSDTALWHNRLGHMSEKGMKLLHSKKVLPGLKCVNMDFCESCVYGKQKRVSFVKSGKEKKNERLELVHTDVWGPAQVSSLGGSLYYVTFIDDATRKVWIYFLRQKSDVFQTFKKWKCLVENETGKKLKCLRSDNGGEYCSTEFEEYCSSNGIRRQKTVPRTPQENGVAERMNRTIMERARSMRLHARLPKNMWAEAVNTAVYLINRGPSTPLDCGIPEEAWSGKKVSYSFLKTFGCEAFALIDSENRTKLEAKSKKCVFVGYGIDEFGYRLWDFENHKIVRSRDVIFNEKVLYKDLLLQHEKKENDYVVLDDTPQVHVPVVPYAPQQQQQQIPHTPVSVRRSTRLSRPPERFSPSLYSILLTDAGEPECYNEAVQVDTKLQWESAMTDEMDSLLKNQTWDLCKLPAGKRALQNKWVYRIKEEDGGTKRFKARLVVKGFAQKHGIDFDEIFSPVVKMTSIRTVLSIVATEDLHLEQLDVKTAFLHGDLDEEIYMVQPQGFEVKGKENLVCRLQKSLYGLKQAPRQWYIKFDTFMNGYGYSRCHSDHCVYFKRLDDDSYIILCLYVDDMLVAGSNMDHIKGLKQQLAKSFAMKDLGAAKQILGMKICRDRKNKKLTLSQADYVEKVLQRFSMQDAKAVSTPLPGHLKLTKDMCPKTPEEETKMSKVPYASAVGSLMYAMVCTRPDIAHAVGVVSRYMSNPGIEHWNAVKWILRYLRGTSSKCLHFGGSTTTVQGYVDSDLAGDIDSRRSTTGYIFTVGGTAVSWISRLQKVVALSTTEAEYVAATEAAKEMIWLQFFMEELGHPQKDNFLHTDSQSAIHLAKNSALHSKTKHIQLRYHFIRSVLDDGKLRLEKIHTDDNPADMFTKVVTREKLNSCSASVGLLD